MFRWGVVMLLALAPLLWWQRPQARPSLPQAPAASSAPDAPGTAFEAGEYKPSEDPATTGGQDPPAPSDSSCVPPTEVLLPALERRPDESDEQYMARSADHLAKVLDSLASSTDPDHLFLRSFSSEYTVEQRLTLLEQASSLDPENALYRYHALRVCAEVPSGCASAPELEAALMSVASDNGEAHAMVAASCLGRQAVDCAYEHLNRAGASSIMTIHYGETIARLERALVATELDFQFRSPFAFSLAAGALTPYSQLTRFCVGPADPRSSVPAAALAQACVAYGERSAASSDTVLGRRIGQAVARHGYLTLGYDEEEASQRIRERIGGEVPVTPISPAVEARLFADKAFFHRYVSVTIESGELAASRWGREEIAREQARCLAAVASSSVDAAPLATERN